MNPVKVAHLSWVRAPIEKYVERCKQAMVTITNIQERLASPPTGADNTWVINQQDKLDATSEELIRLLSGITSALDVIESHGGHTISSEAKTLARVVLDKRDFEVTRTAMLAIQAAISVIPSYIGMVMEGAHDSPGVLLEYINEMRKIRGVPDLNDAQSLVVNLNFGYVSPPLYEPDCDLTERDRIFKKAAAEFCISYSQAMRDRDSAAPHWEAMREHLRGLQRVTNDPQLGSYWWVGEAIIDVIIAENCYFTPAMNSAIGVVMVATQRLSGGEESALKNVSPAKFSSMLNALSISRKQTATSQAVVAQFDIKENVEQESIAALEAQLASQSVKTISDVLPEIQPRLEAAMIAFGRAVGAKTEKGFAVQVQAYDQAMRTIANIFGIFNEQELSEISFYLADSMKGVHSPSELSNEIIESVKSQILFLDSKLKSLTTSKAALHLQIDSVGGDIVDHLCAQTEAELTKASQSIAVHVESGVGSEKLLDALDSLRELASVYEFAGATAIAKILAAIVSVISEDVTGGQLNESDRLILAARALVGVQSYFQYINNKLTPPTTFIAAANSAVRDLGMDADELRILSHSDLLSKFEVVEEADAEQQDGLLREIFEVRSSFEELQTDVSTKDLQKLAAFSTAGLRISAAANLQGEKRFADLARYASELARLIPSHIDSPSYNIKASTSALLKAVQLIMRCMDEYASKGKINLFLIDATEELAKLVGVIEPADNEQEQAATEVENAGPAREYPAGTDVQLQELFDEEFKEQIAVLRTYTAGIDLTVTELVCRAIHTIHGCSGSAGCKAISTLFDVLEARFYALRACEGKLTLDQAFEFESLLASVEEYQSEFPWNDSIDELPEWLEAAGKLTGQHVDAVSEVTVSTEPSLEFNELENHQDEIQPVSVPEIAIEVDQVTDSTAQVHAVSAESEAYEEQPVEEPKAAQQPVDQKPVLPTAAQAEPEYDVTDGEFYLCDADEHIPALQENIEQWVSDMDNNDIAVNIRRSMHTLKGAANLIGARGISKLTHNMESLFIAMTSGAFKADKNCVDLTRFVLNELVMMTDAVRASQPYRIITELTDFVGECCEVNEVDGDTLASIISASYGQSVYAAQAETTQPKEEITPAFVDEPVALTITENVVANTAAPAPVQVPASEPAPVSEPAQCADDIAKQEDPAPAEATGTRRGYRGLRGRAHGERQSNYDTRQLYKNNGGRPEKVNPATLNQTPDLIDIETQPAKASSIVSSLMERIAEQEVSSQAAKRKNGSGNEKIKVELAMLDNSVKLANELKASSYRQKALHSEMVQAFNGIREKLSLLLMQANKTTVQLRHFNNLSNHTARQGTPKSEDQELYLERFNHLSHGHTQFIASLQQVLEDTNEILIQSGLMHTGFSYQAEVVGSLQRDLLQSRLVKFENEKPNLAGALRFATQSSGKKAEIEVQGGDTRVDRLLLESIRDPLRHVVNNAIAHGIEEPAERLQSGKPESGEIKVKASRRAKSFIIQVTDDGRGIDPQVIRAKAIAKNLISEDDELSEQDVYSLLAEPGFSTATKVDELAGRGVGMDIVRSRLAALGGNLHINSVVGKGSTISLELPLTVDSNRALVCRISNQWFAIPTYNMVQVLDFPTTELMAIKAKPGQAQVKYEDKSYDVIHLADLMAVPDLKIQAAQTPSHTCLVLIEQGKTRLAIEVESGVTMPEIHITKMEGIMSNVKGLIGSTEVHDGTPALVLDVIEMARLNLKLEPTGYKPRLYRIRRIKREERPHVLIVDDSHSYQKLLTRHFQNLGWETSSALNGHEALDKLQTLKAPHLFVVDVEMPRMNGLELTQRLRAVKTFDNTPIIMLTTRANLKDEAIALGVNEFLAKPYDASVLNEAIRAVLPEQDKAGAA